MALVNPKADILTVTGLGFGKRSKFEEYRVQSRGGKGVINIKVTDRNGPVVGAKTVTDRDEVMLVTQEGMMVRAPVKDVRLTGRAAQGVRLISVKGKDSVASVARVAPKDEEDVVAPVEVSPKPAEAQPPVFETPESVADEALGEPAVEQPARPVSKPKASAKPAHAKHASKPTPVSKAKTKSKRKRS